MTTDVKRRLRVKRSKKHRGYALGKKITRFTLKEEKREANFLNEGAEKCLVSPLFPVRLKMKHNKNLRSDCRRQKFKKNLLLIKSYYILKIMEVKS